MNKKGMELALGLFIGFTLVFIIVSLTFFHLRETDIQDTLYTPGVVDEVYIREIGLDYYLDDIFEKSVDDFKFEDGKQEFIDHFKSNLEDYKVIEEFENLEEQLIEDNIELTSEGIVLRLRLEVEKVYDTG